MSEKFSYSINDDKYFQGHYDSRPAALQAAVNDALDRAIDEEPQREWQITTGRNIPHKNSEFFPSADEILESMQSSADDTCGEFSEGYMDCPPKAEAELEQQLYELLNTWCDKHGISPSFFTVRDFECTPLEEAMERLRGAA